MQELHWPELWLPYDNFIASGAQPELKFFPSDIGYFEGLR